MPMCKMMPAPMKLSAAVVIQSSGVALALLHAVGAGGQGAVERERHHDSEGAPDCPR
jgi:hypothetical protein